MPRKEHRLDETAFTEAHPSQRFESGRLARVVEAQHEHSELFIVLLEVTEEGEESLRHRAR